MKARVFLSLIVLILSAVKYFSQDYLSFSSIMDLSHTQAKAILSNPILTNAYELKGFHNEVCAIASHYQSDDHKSLFMILSTDQRSNPLIMYSYGEDRVKLWQDKATKVALKKMEEPLLKETYYLGFGEVWNLFIDNNDTIFIKHFPPEKILTPREFEAHKVLIKQFYQSEQSKVLQKSQVQNEWQMLTEGKLINPISENYILYVGLVPDFDWHGGCTPTAASDLLGFYDEAYGYGNIIKYYYSGFDPTNPNEYDYVVPDILEILRDKLETDNTGTTAWEIPHAERISQAANQQDPNYSWNDYGYLFAGLWNKIKDEIDNGYPIILDVVFPGNIGHSMPVFGYRTDPKAVYLYDTWDRGAYFFSTSDFREQSVAWIHPPLVQTNKGIYLTKYEGDCKALTSDNDRMYTNQPNEIKWSCDQAGWGKVSIYINTDSGKINWIQIADKVNNTGSYNWQPGSNYIGDHNRIKVVLFDGQGNNVASDGSCTDFKISKGSFPMLSTGESIETDWPSTAGCISTTTQWAVMAIKTFDITKQNYLRIYSDTNFVNIQATDSVDASGSLGFCAINVGSTGGPPGPYGVKIGQSGNGRLQYRESESLGWGQNLLNQQWLKNWDLVKAYDISVSQADISKLYQSTIILNNYTQGDFVITIFDTHKRYNNFSDALISIDNNGAGLGESLNLSNVQSTSSRLLVVVWQKGTILYEGQFNLSLIPGKNFPAKTFTINKADTVDQSDVAGSLAPLTTPWRISGIIPLGGSRWQIEAALNRNFTDSLVISNLGETFTNIIVFRNPSLNKISSATDSIFIRLRRITGSGKVHIEINDTGNDQPLHDGINTTRIWPKGVSFKIIPFNSSVPLKNLKIFVEASPRKIYSAIAPNVQKRFLTTAMLWGYDSPVPISTPDVKNGAAVLWLREISNEQFNYIVKTSQISSADEANLPSEFKLYQNYPNPFNPSTIISYSLSVPGFVILKVYDTLGREVETLVNELKAPGYYTVEWLPKNLSSGIYFYGITAGNYSAFRKMLLIK